MDQPHSPCILTPDRPARLVVAVDHGQFIVIDRDSQIDVDAYGLDAQANGLAVWSDGVAVFCESHWTDGTTVVINLADRPPDIELAAFDHVAIAGLSCQSGELRVFAPEETGVAERQVLLPPGVYGMLVCGDRFGTGDEYGDNGNDRYTLTLWPCAEPPPGRALKNGRRRLTPTRTGEPSGHSRNGRRLGRSGSWR